MAAAIRRLTGDASLAAQAVAGLVELVTLDRRQLELGRGMVEVVRP